MIYTRRIFFALILIALALTVYSGGSVHWSYEGETGPNHWADLSAEWAICSDGLAQSPIDIPANAVLTDDLEELSFDYSESSNLFLINNGHTIKAETPLGAGQLEIGDDVYDLIQFHFHTPSEHLVDGDDFPMEMHLVHSNSQGELAVVGIFLEIGCSHEALNKIFKRLPAHEGDSFWAMDFDLEALVPDETHAWRYSGSLTTPDCREGVKWHVMVETQTISAKQAQAFIDLFSGAHFPFGNARPVQPLNGRTVSIDD